MTPNFGVPDWALMREHRHIDDPEDGAVWAGLVTANGAVIEVDFDGGKEPVPERATMGPPNSSGFASPVIPPVGGSSSVPPTKIKTTVRRGEWIVGRGEPNGTVRLWVVPGLWFRLKYREVTT